LAAGFLDLLAGRGGDALVVDDPIDGRRTCEGTITLC
jgi:hypothetical protein